ncbi:hypothetical protein ACFL21_03740, partial [Patescibacteria group bacterium]
MPNSGPPENTEFEDEALASTKTPDLSAERDSLDEAQNQLQETPNPDDIIMNVAQSLNDVIYLLSPEKRLQLQFVLTGQINHSFEDEEEDFNIDPRIAARIIFRNRKSTSIALRHTPERPLKPFNSGKPSSATTRHIKEAKGREQEKIEKMKKQVETITSILLKMFQAFHKSPSPELISRIDSYSKKLITKRNPTLDWIKEFLSQEDSFLYQEPFYLSLKEIQTQLNRPEILELLVDALNVRKGPS